MALNLGQILWNDLSNREWTGVSVSRELAKYKLDLVEYRKSDETRVALNQQTHILLWKWEC
jgi:hypothetical protein